jgi:hypothetical protein
MKNNYPTIKPAHTPKPEHYTAIPGPVVPVVDVPQHPILHTHPIHIDDKPVAPSVAPVVTNIPLQVPTKTKE